MWCYYSLHIVYICFIHTYINLISLCVSHISQFGVFGIYNGTKIRRNALVQTDFSVADTATSSLDIVEAFKKFRFLLVPVVILCILILTLACAWHRLDLVLYCWYYDTNHNYNLLICILCIYVCTYLLCVCYPLPSPSIKLHHILSRCNQNWPLLI